MSNPAEMVYEFRVVIPGEAVTPWSETDEHSALALLEHDGFEVRRREVGPWSIVAATE